MNLEIVQILNRLFADKSFTYSTFSPIRIAALVLCTIVTIYFAAKARKNRLFFIYLLFQSAVIVNMFFYCTIYILPINWLNNKFLGTDLFSLITNLRNIIIDIGGLCWLAFCWLYTGRKLGQRKILLIVGFPALIHIGLIFTNIIADIINGNHFPALFDFFTEVSFLYCFDIIITQGYLIAGVIVLLAFTKKRSRYFIKQTTLIVLSSFIYIISGISQYFTRFYLNYNSTFEKLFGFILYNAVPLGCCLSMFLLVIAGLRYSFLNIVPIARHKIVSNLRESIIVLDNENCIVDCNTVFSKTFPHFTFHLNGTYIADFADYIKNAAEKDPEIENLIYSLKNPDKLNYNGEFSICNSEEKSYSIDIQPISQEVTDRFGRIISINDITEYRNLLSELDQKNRELSVINEQLRKYADNIEELVVSRERNRFAREVHDVLGHSMTLIIALLEVSTITCKKDPETTGQKLNDALMLARESLKTIRRSVSELTVWDIRPDGLNITLDELFIPFRASGVNIDFSIMGECDYSKFKHSKIIYMACKEALNNSIRHGRASNVVIMLKFKNEKVILYIFDDGSGCENVIKGFGLEGMEQAVRNVKGDLWYGSDGEKGFNIKVEIPVG